MTDLSRARLTPDLVAAMADAADSPIPEDHLHDATELLAALYALESRLDQLDLDGIEPEFRWDARWNRGAEEARAIRRAFHVREGDTPAAGAHCSPDDRSRR